MMKKFKFIGKALFFPEEKILAISDLHIGFEATLNEAGIFLPRRQFKETLSELKKIFERAEEVNEVIVLGDLKHEFGSISRQEWDETLKILEYLSGYAGKIILIKGNHDTILEPIVKLKRLNIKDVYVQKNICFLHGHKAFPECDEKKIKTLVMGHKHPAITIREGAKSETYKCFLVGNYKGKEIIILPSFFPFIEGSNMIIGDTNLAFNFKLKKFEAFVLEGEKVYDFGKVKEIGKLIF